MTGGCGYLIRVEKNGVLKHILCKAEDAPYFCNPGAKYCTASSENKRLAGIEIAASMKSEEKNCMVKTDE